MEVATMTVSADDELAQLRAQRMAQIQSQLEEQAAAQADAEIQQQSQQACNSTIGLSNEDHPYSRRKIKISQFKSS